MGLVITSPVEGFVVNASTLTVTVTTTFGGTPQFVKVSRPNFIAGRPDWHEIYSGTVTGGTYSVVVPIVQGTDDWPIKLDAFETPSESGSIYHAVPVNGTIKGIVPAAGTKLVEVPVIDNTFSATIPIAQGATELPLTVEASLQDATASVDGTITQIAPSLKSIGIEPATIVGGNSAVCTIQVDLPAFAGGEVIETWSDDPGIVMVPSSVTIPPGATAASFPVRTTEVDVDRVIFIWAKLRDRTMGVELPVHPPPSKPPPVCEPVIVYCPPLVCCPRRDYVYAVSSLNIWQTSDYGMNQSLDPAHYYQNQEDVSNLVLDDAADLMLLAGNHRFDGDYLTTSEPFWGNMLRRQVALPIPGPQDWSYSGLEQYKKYFGYPPIQPSSTTGQKTYGSARFGDVEFFLLDTGLDVNGVHGNPDVVPNPATGKLTGTLWKNEGCGEAYRIWDPQGGSAEWNWFVRAAHESDARWKIVIIHQPPLSSGSVHGSWPEFYWNYAELGIDLVLSGHEASYERLKYSGVTYIVNGLGGSPATGFSSTPLPQSQVRFGGRYGALNFIITNRKIVGQFLAVDHRIQDQFQIAKP